MTLIAAELQAPLEGIEKSTLTLWISGIADRAAFTFAAVAACDNVVVG